VTNIWTQYNYPKGFTLRAYFMSKPVNNWL